MNKDRRLGRGLAALLGAPLDEGIESTGGTGAVAAPQVPAPQTPSPTTASPVEAPADEPSQANPVATGQLLQLDVYQIDDNPFQPRRDFSEPEIASLAESLREHQMLQPILVRLVGERYQLISGERRLRAAIQAGWSKVPAQLREADDRLVAELAIVENLQRKDLNPVEKALSFRRYLDEHDCSQEEFARRLKIDRSTIANLMRLLELPESVLDALRNGSISAGHARALLPLGDEGEQAEFATQIRLEGLSVRAVEAIVQERIRKEDGPILGVVGGEMEPATRKRTRSEQVASLEQRLRTSLGTKVEIRQTAKGRGRIVINFGGHDEFERIYDILTDSVDVQTRVG